VKRPVASPEVEEVAGASTSVPPTRFHRDYLPPRMENAPPVNVPANGKYPLPIAPVPDGVSSDEDMLGKISSLKFMDHDITDAQKFPELAREKYLHTRSIPGIGEILLEP
jgi:hypothetical protein